MFIEKEGFDPLLQHAQIAERFDLAIMSNKGMSVTAGRALLDQLGGRFERVFVLHDFDISGFSILGTLGADSRRYTYQHRVDIVDLVLRLVDVEAMGLQSESVNAADCSGRAETLIRHGATNAEVWFLCRSARRVELNAMTSVQFIDFLERKLKQFGAEKVIPTSETINPHARQLIVRRLAQNALDEIGPEIGARADEYRSPGNLPEQVRKMVTENPELAWDDATARIVETSDR